MVVLVGVVVLLVGVVLVDVLVVCDEVVDVLVELVRVERVARLRSAAGDDGCVTGVPTGAELVAGRPREVVPGTGGPGV